MAAPNCDNNGLICFTNCLLPLEDGQLVNRDLWIDEEKGVVLNAQRTFFHNRKRPAKIIDLGGNILSPGFIDVQINGAYGVDFSIYNGDDQVYLHGLQTVAEKIVETGVTSLVPTIITQQKALYPKLLSLLRPRSYSNAAHLLGWHAEGPFLQLAKRGAHAIPYLMSPQAGFETFEDVYGAANLKPLDDFDLDGDSEELYVRMVTAAPELEGVLSSISELTERGVIFSIGHSIASTDLATLAVTNGARLITHLFNAMPQLHHRDPSIIGLLGAMFPVIPEAMQNPAALQFHSRTKSSSSIKSLGKGEGQRKTTLPPTQEATGAAGSEALMELPTPPHSPTLRPTQSKLHATRVNEEARRPFYGIIVDGIHSHPNSVRLAYTAHPEGCILITDAMPFMDPHLPDGSHDWRDGKRLVKDGVKLFIEGTDTLAGSVVTLDSCVRKFARFTGSTLAQAIVCATYHPAKCLNIDHKKGTLRPGSDADLVVLNPEGHVLSTWVKGKKVWERNAK